MILTFTRQAALALRQGQLNRWLQLDTTALPRLAALGDGLHLTRGPGTLVCRQQGAARVAQIDGLAARTQRLQQRPGQQPGSDK